ncbi:MAG: hypothetical protein Q9204_001789 [Flavoplaca sp. TL-2023a]
MPKVKPQMSITLPRNFAFHYTEGEEPKTPEQHHTTPTAHPPSPQAYRLKRRIRPTIQTSTHTQAQLTQQLLEAPVPIIEAPAPLGPEPLRPSFEPRATEPADGYLAPPAARLFLTQPRPRTPVMQRVQLQACWNTPEQKEIGDSIIRPLSRCSITSDSSDESSGSLTSYPSLGGSCTSPESDAVDPFVLPSIKRSTMKGRIGILANPELSRSSSRPVKQSSTQWTTEMDQHIWSVYTQYLQDPTITPFKTLPGTVPPLGVCHRVARQAKRTWRGLGQASQTPSREMTKSTDNNVKFGQSPESTETGRSGTLSMQPGGPLAQLADNESAAPKEVSNWSNDPSAPWASPPAVPSSDIDREYVAPFHRAPETSHSGSPLGSPFSGSKTWGPSRSRQHIRPTTPRTQSSQVASTIGPTLRSPIRFNGRNPYPSVSKRRAQHELEDELSPGGSEKTNVFEGLFGGPPEGRHRRVRSRGFSLGDAIRPNSYETPIDPSTGKEDVSQKASAASTSDNLRVPDTGEPIPRLGSPFSTSGGGSMPSRRPSRHIASASLSSCDPASFGNFASIDQRIRQSDLDEDFLRRLRE